MSRRNRPNNRTKDSPAKEPDVKKKEEETKADSASAATPENAAPPAATANDASPDPEAPEEVDLDKIPPYKRCPACWGGYKGYAAKQKYHRRVGGLLRRYFQCNQCGNNWHIDVRVTETVERINGQPAVLVNDEYYEEKSEVYSGQHAPGT
tara:strand:- start:23354 stop:23806 length:453 start_codon:yes stop_codon:yes gene_type:complete